jgi:hypothetical protein
MESEAGVRPEAPTSKQAKEIIHELDPLVQLISQRSDYSPGQRSAAISDLYAYVQFHGCPSFFLTVAPCAVCAQEEPRYSVFGGNDPLELPHFQQSLLHVGHTAASGATRGAHGTNERIGSKSYMTGLQAVGLGVAAAVLGVAKN